MIQELTVIGIMSGTSLDGLDFCCTKFNYNKGIYQYEIIAAETHKYSAEIESKLKRAFDMSKAELSQFDVEYGSYIGNAAKNFIDKYELQNTADLIGSHGHTIYHEPENGFTCQIGDGQQIASLTGVDVINDFRSGDVKLGGQGAPLVPIGDKLLFSSNESCLNLGGFANISFDQDNTRIAFDICPANLPLNALMEAHFNAPFDKDGSTAESGTVIPEMLNELNNLKFYKLNHPKSLGVEWLNEHFHPILKKYSSSKPEDILHTIVQHQTDIIAKTWDDYNISSCLITGGGVFNSFFIDCLKAKSGVEIIIPENNLIEYKEALIFAFLAFLNKNNQVNILKSVTGAKSDSTGGVEYHPK